MAHPHIIEFGEMAMVTTEEQCMGELRRVSDLTPLREKLQQRWRVTTRRGSGYTIHDEGRDVPYVSTLA